MFDVNLDKWDEEILAMPMSAYALINLFMGDEAIRRHSSVIFAFGKNPNDINKFYRKGGLILEKPDSLHIFI